MKQNVQSETYFPSSTKFVFFITINIGASGHQQCGCPTAASDNQPGLCQWFGYALDQTIFKMLTRHYASILRICCSEEMIFSLRLLLTYQSTVLH